MNNSPPIHVDLAILDRILHELRKPLAAIQAFTDLLEEEISGELNEEQHDYARTVLDHVERLDGHFRHLRELAALEVGEEWPEPVAIGVDELLERVEARHAERFHARGLRFYVELPDPPFAVRAEPERLGEAISCILENCHRLVPDGGDVAVGASRHGDRIRLEIKDTGPGIRVAEVDRVFSPFHRTGARGVDTPPPTLGIGLALARGIAESLGGGLTARERPTGGTCFRFDLPVAVPAAPHADSKGNGGDVPAARGGKVSATNRVKA